MKFYDYLLDRGEKVKLQAIEQHAAGIRISEGRFTKVYEHRAEGNRVY